MRYRLRKRVRFPRKKWRDVYCYKRWNYVPKFPDKNLMNFMDQWGDGVYIIVNSKREIIDKFYNSRHGYRCRANKKGRPIFPYDHDEETPHCPHCWQKGYDKYMDKTYDYIKVSFNEGKKEGYNDGYWRGYREGIDHALRYGTQSMYQKGINDTLDAIKDDDEYD